MNHPMLSTICLLITCAIGCSSTPSSKPGTATAGDPNETGASAGNDGGALDAKDSVVRIHYPIAAGQSFTLRGDVSPLSVDHGLAMTVSGNTAEIHVALDRKAHVTPYLNDETPARGGGSDLLPGATLDLYPHFLNRTGTVEKLFPAFHSKAMEATPVNNDQAVWAYLPASYSENTLIRYPVFYLHDGQNLWVDANSTDGTAWHADTAIDNAIEQGTIAELIVIAPEHGPQRQGEYAPVTDPGYPQSDTPGGPFYAQMIATELKPAVDAMLRTRADRANTGVLGSSLGGLMSAYEGLMYPNVFGLIGEMSPSAWWDGDWIVFHVDQQTRPPAFDKLYVDQGTVVPEGSLDAPLLVTEYEEQGYGGDDFEYFVEEGGSHDEAAWGRRLPHALAFLLPPDRDVGATGGAGGPNPSDQ